MAYKQRRPIIVSEGGTGATTITGILTGNGTSAVTANTVTQHGVLIGGASNAASSLGVATNGQLPIGSTGADPVLATISAGTGISVSNGAGSISLSTTSAAGNWVLIQSQTASSSASLSFTTGITGYQVYAWVLDRVIPATNAVNLRLLLSTDGGGSYIATNYTSGNNYWSYNSATFSHGGDTTTSMVYVNGLVNTSTAGNSFTVYVSTSSGVTPYLWGSGYGNSVMYFVQGANTTTSVVNAFQWLMSSGNIASGTFSLYGIKQ